MFSSLNQGNLVYILDKTNGIKLQIGEVVSVSAPHVNYNPSGFNNSLIDLKIKVEGSINDYNSIPSSYSIITYNNNKLTISETKLGLQSEVEGLLRNSKSILDNIDTYKLNIQDCENILKDLNPQFAKDKERDERLNSLETKFDGVESKLDQLLTLVSNK